MASKMSLSSVSLDKKDLIKTIVKDCTLFKRVCIACIASIPLVCGTKI